MGNSVKIKDVAEAAGVSTATVSYVMNGKAEGLGITLATRQRVLDAVKRTGYRPNKTARDMALGCLPPAGQEELLSCQVAELPPAERVVGCQVAELLGDGPNGQPLTTQQHNNLTTGRDSAATQQHNNLTTILAAAGYSLVPVASVNDLSRLPGGGLVGVIYKPASFVPMSGTTAAMEGRGKSKAPVVTAVPAVVTPTVRRAAEERITPVVTAVPAVGTVDGLGDAEESTAAPVEPDESAEAPVVTGACPELVERVSPVETATVEPVPTPVTPPPEVVVPVEVTPVTLVDGAADTPSTGSFGAAQDGSGQAAATTEESATAPGITAVPGDDEAALTTQQPDNLTTG